MRLGQGDATALDRPDPRPAGHDLTRSMLQVLFIGALAVGSLWVMRPFVLASIWATTIVVATWPLMLRVERWLGGRRGLAVAAMTAALLLVLVVPLCVGLAAILGNTETIVGWSKALAA